MRTLALLSPRAARGLLATVLVCALPGCGIGVGQMLVGGSVGKNDDNWLSSGNEEYLAGTSIGPLRANVITAYDSSGILLAALGTAANAQAAEQEARQQAIDNGGQDGDVYSYSYEVVPPAQGTETTLTLAWGSRTGATATRDGVDYEMPDASVDYLRLDLRAKFVSWDLDYGMNLGLVLGMIYEGFTVSGTYQMPSSADPSVLVAVAHELDDAWIGMPFGVTFEYRVLGPLSVSARVALDPVISGVAAMLLPNWFWMEAGVRVAFRPTDWFLVFADASHRVQPYALGKRSGSATEAQVGIAFLWDPDWV